MASHLGHRPNGYVSFRYELPAISTSAATNEHPDSACGHLGAAGFALVCGRGNLPACAARGHGPRSHCRRWRLCQRPESFQRREATVEIETTVTNESASPREINVQTSLLAPDGEAVSTIESNRTIGAGDQPIIGNSKSFFQIRNYGISMRPDLYHAVSKVLADGNILDEQTNTFGIRDAHFEADTGFWLNGKNFKLKGVCLHADGGAFGAAVPLSIWEARLKTLKSLGVNAIRTAHNPPAPEFLDLCDRLGLLVMDEFFDCWTVGKKSLRLSLYFNEWSHTDERDIDSTRPQSSQHHYLQRRQRNSRSAAS